MRILVFGVGNSFDDIERWTRYFSDTKTLFKDLNINISQYDQRFSSIEWFGLTFEDIERFETGHYDDHIYWGDFNNLETLKLLSLIPMSHVPHILNMDYPIQEVSSAYDIIIFDLQTIKFVCWQRSHVNVILSLLNHNGRLFFPLVDDVTKTQNMCDMVYEHVLQNVRSVFDNKFYEVRNDGHYPIAPVNYEHLQSLRFSSYDRQLFIERHRETMRMKTYQFTYYVFKKIVSSTYQPLCKGITKQGRPCQNVSQYGSKYCHVHQN
jgi:hypothetical protein